MKFAISIDYDPVYFVAESRCRRAYQVDDATFRRWHRAQMAFLRMQREIEAALKQPCRRGKSRV